MYNLNSWESAQRPRLHHSTGQIRTKGDERLRVQRLQHSREGEGEGEGVSRESMEGSRDSLVLRHIYVRRRRPSRLERLVQRRQRVRSPCFFLSINITVRIQCSCPKKWRLDRNQLRFAEVKCRGSGANASKRVKWANKLSEKELKELTSIYFIDGEGWLRNLPFNIFAA